MFQQGMAQMGGGINGQPGEDQQQDAAVPGHTNVGVSPSQSMAGAYGTYSPQK